MHAVMVISIPAGRATRCRGALSTLFKHEPFQRLRKGARTTQPLDLDIWSRQLTFATQSRRIFVD
jgi:hypothetical protein